MTLHEHRFDGASVTASAQLGVPNTPRNVHRRIVISVCLEPAHLTAERPLIRSICAVGVMAHTALLGTVRTDDRGARGCFEKGGSEHGTARLPKPPHW
jgi:hypothetical protein